MKQQHQNNTFIDRKQGSLSSLREKHPAEKRSITIILKTILLIPSNPIYTKFMLVVEPDYLPDAEVLAFSRVYTP
jgi:hypothetical protein